MLSISSYKYAYLLGCLYFLLVWLILFFRLKDKRKSMLVIGLLWMWTGVVCEYFFWLKDWWRPQNITGTFIGLEDFILSFAHLGVAIFVYKYVFKKDSRGSAQENGKKAVIRLAAVLVLLLGSMTTLYYVFLIPSYISTTASLFIAGIFLASKRPDLMRPGAWTAILLFAITGVMFLFGKLVYPDIIIQLWYPATSGTILGFYPLADAVWYLALGFLMGGVYEYTFNKKFVVSKNPSLKDDVLGIYQIIKRFIKGESLIG